MIDFDLGFVGKLTFFLNIIVQDDHHFIFKGLCFQVTEKIRSCRDILKEDEVIAEAVCVAIHLHTAI